MHSFKGWPYRDVALPHEERCSGSEGPQQNGTVLRAADDLTEATTRDTLIDLFEWSISVMVRNLHWSLNGECASASISMHLLYYSKFKNRVARLPHHIPPKSWSFCRAALGLLEAIQSGSIRRESLDDWCSFLGGVQRSRENSKWNQTRTFRSQRYVCDTIRYLKGCIRYHHRVTCGREAVVFAPQHGTRTRPGECSLSRCYRKGVEKSMQIMKTLKTYWYSHSHSINESPFCI